MELEEAGSSFGGGGAIGPLGGCDEGFEGVADGSSVEIAVWTGASGSGRDAAGSRLRS